MKNILFAAFVCALLTGGAGAYGQQVQLLEMEPRDAAPQIILQEPEIAEPPKAAVTKSKTPAASVKTTAKAPAKKKSAVKPAAAIPVVTDAGTSALVKKLLADAEQSHVAMAAAAKPAAAAVKPVEVVEFAPKFEMQLSSVPVKAAAKPAATVKPAVILAKAAAPKVAPAAAAVPRPAAAPAASAGFFVEKKHKVNGGDTLWGLSGKYYRDPYKWGKIYNANLNTVANPDRIYPKDELLIPDITEEVSPARKGPEVIAGADTVQEGELSVSDVEQADAAAAASEAAEQQALTIKPGALREEMSAFERNDLSSEMPRDQKEWSSFTKVVSDNWAEDGVISSKEQTSSDVIADGLSFSGELVVIKLSGGVQLKKGDFATVYLRGAAAYDNQGKKIGRELQTAGMVVVVSVDGRMVKARVVDASSTIRKGMAVKLSVRS